MHIFVLFVNIQTEGNEKLFCIAVPGETDGVVSAEQLYHFKREVRNFFGGIARKMCDYLEVFLFEGVVGVHTVGSLILSGSPIVLALSLAHV